MKNKDLYRIDDNTVPMLKSRVRFLELNSSVLDREFDTLCEGKKVSEYLCLYLVNGLSKENEMKLNNFINANKKLENDIHSSAYRIICKLVIAYPLYREAFRDYVKYCNNEENISDIAHVAKKR